MSQSKIHGAVRLDNAVYLPDNDDHVEWLADRLNGKQKRRLLISGTISGPLFEEGADPPEVAESPATSDMPEPPPVPEAIPVETMPPAPPVAENAVTDAGLAAAQAEEAAAPIEAPAQWGEVASDGG